MLGLFEQDCDFVERIEKVESSFNTLDFQSGGQGFEPGHCHLDVSLDKKLYYTLSLFTQVYKWVLAIIMLGGNPAMD